MAAIRDLLWNRVAMNNLNFSFSDRGLLSPASGASGNTALVEVLTIRLDVEPEAVRAALSLLSEAEQQRARRFAFDCDRRRFAVTRSRLRRLLGERLSVRPESVSLVYGKYGKPALSPCFASANLHFNVSHAEDVAAFAFAHGRPVGIDIEAVRDFRDADDIAERCFSSQEYASYRALARCQRPLGFFNCWTRKEAFVKALGDGLGHSFSSFDVSLAPGEITEILHSESAAGEGRRWTLRSFSSGQNIVGAVVAGEWSGGVAQKKFLYEVPSRKFSFFECEVTK
jgi:4'-phosphopantetheinyl transferase